MASTLPLELISMICSYMSHSDLKTGRLVSREWNAAAEQRLFACVNLKFNLLSFNRVRCILESSRLATHVKTLHYDVRRLPRGIDGVDDWICFAGHGWTTSGDHSFAYWKKHIHEHKDVYFERTLRLVKEQEDLCAGSVRTSKEYVLLRNVIRQCPQLQTLSFESGFDQKHKIIYWQPGCALPQSARVRNVWLLIEGRDDHDPKSQLSHVGQQTLIEPHYTADGYYKSLHSDGEEPDDFHPRRFRIFMEAARLEGKQMPKLIASESTVS